MSDAICNQPDCEKPVKVKTSGMCGAHYQAARKRGEHTPGFRWIGEDGLRMVCEYLDCERDVKARGLCAMHYGRALAGKRPKKGFRETKWVNPDGSRKVCSVEDCESEVLARGVCSAHYHAEWKIGTDREPLPAKICPVPTCGRKMVNRATLCGRCNQARWRYGLSAEGWLGMNRNYRCSNLECGATERLHIDHDHSCSCQGLLKRSNQVSCGACVRGWLCRSCNLGLGYFRDDPRLLQGIKNYAEQWKTPSEEGASRET